MHELAQAVVTNTTPLIALRERGIWLSQDVVRFALAQ